MERDRSYFQFVNLHFVHVNFEQNIVLLSHKAERTCVRAIETTGKYVSAFLSPALRDRKNSYAPLFGFIFSVSVAQSVFRSGSTSPSSVPDFLSETSKEPYGLVGAVGSEAQRDAEYVWQRDRADVPKQQTRIGCVGARRVKYVYFVFVSQTTGTDGSVGVKSDSRKVPVRVGFERGRWRLRT